MTRVLVLLYGALGQKDGLSFPKKKGLKASKASFIEPKARASAEDHSILYQRIEKGLTQVLVIPQTYV